jgi:ABC-type amino acid transport substrate-binding protein
MKNFTKIVKSTLLLALLASNTMAKDSVTLGTEDWAPFSFKDSKTKKITGLSTEIIEGALETMGVKIKSNKVFPWARTQEMGFQGKFDAVYTASINDERKEYMLFPSEPVVSSKWVLFSTKKNKDKLKFDDLTSLKGKKFCLIGGYNYPKDFKEYIKKNADMSSVSTETLNISKLVNGRCDYMPAVLETTLEKIKTDKELKALNAYDKIFYFEKPLTTTNFYLMFSKKSVDQAFVDRFSEALKKFKTTPKYKAILKKYL